MTHPANCTSLGRELVTDTSEVHTPYAFIGVPFGPPYEPADVHVAAGAADAVRAVTYRYQYATDRTRYDFDYGAAIFPDDNASVSDCGDVEGDVRNPDDIAQRATEAIKPLVRVGVVPLASPPAEHRFVIPIDCDDWDPSIAPAVGWPEPGGLTHVQIATILRRLAAANRVVAAIITESQPALDHNAITAQTIARLFVNVIDRSRCRCVLVAPESRGQGTMSDTNAKAGPQRAAAPGIKRTRPPALQDSACFASRAERLCTSVRVLCGDRAAHLLTAHGLGHFEFRLARRKALASDLPAESIGVRALPTASRADHFSALLGKPGGERFCGAWPAGSGCGVVPPLTVMLCWAYASSYTISLRYPQRMKDPAASGT